MKNRSLLLSMILASAFHGALLFVTLPSYGNTPPSIPPSVEVNLIEAMPSQEAGSAGPPAPVQHIDRIEAKRIPAVTPRVRPAFQISPMKPPPAPAPQPAAVEPEPIEAAFVQEPEETAPAVPEAEYVQPAWEMTDAAYEREIGSANSSTASGGGTVDALTGSSLDSGGEGGRSGTGAVVDRMPAYAYNPKPKYPSAARRAGQQGTAILRVEVLFSGNVNRIVLEKSSGYDLLDKEAVEAVKIWRFNPARRGTRAVTAWVRIPIEFTLRDDHE